MVLGNYIAGEEKHSVQICASANQWITIKFQILKEIYFVSKIQHMSCHIFQSELWYSLLLWIIYNILYLFRTPRTEETFATQRICEEPLFVFPHIEESITLESFGVFFCLLQSCGGSLFDQLRLFQTQTKPCSDISLCFVIIN